MTHNKFQSLALACIIGWLIGDGIAQVAESNQRGSIEQNQALIISNQDTIKAEQEAQHHDITLIFEELAVIGQDSIHSTE